MPEYEYKFELKIRGTNKIFREGMSPGVVFSEVADFSENARQGA